MGRRNSRGAAAARAEGGWEVVMVAVREVARVAGARAMG